MAIVSDRPRPCGVGLPLESPDNEGLYKQGARCRVIQGSGPTISANPEFPMGFCAAEPLPPAAIMLPRLLPSRPKARSLKAS